MSQSSWNDLSLHTLYTYTSVCLEDTSHLQFARLASRSPSLLQECLQYDTTTLEGPREHFRCRWLRCRNLNKSACSCIQVPARVRSCCWLTRAYHIYIYIYKCINVYIYRSFLRSCIACLHTKPNPFLDELADLIYIKFTRKSTSVQDNVLGRTFTHLGGQMTCLFVHNSPFTTVSTFGI